MEINDQQTKIQSVTESCKAQWRSRGIPENEVRLMVREVEEDLRHAARRDRTIEEVVGPDVEGFARSYTIEGSSPETPKDRILTWVVVAVLFLLIVLSLLRFLTVLEIWLPWPAALALVAVAAAVLLFVWDRRAR